MVSSDLEIATVAPTITGAAEQLFKEKGESVEFDIGTVI